MFKKKIAIDSSFDNLCKKLGINPYSVVCKFMEDFVYGLHVQTTDLTKYLCSNYSQINAYVENSRIKAGLKQVISSLCPKLRSILELCSQNAKDEGCDVVSLNRYMVFLASELPQLIIDLGISIEEFNKHLQSFISVEPKSGEFPIFGADLVNAFESLYRDHVQDGNNEHIEIEHFVSYVKLYWEKINMA